MVMQAPITIKSGQPRLKCIHAHTVWKAGEKNSENQYICMPCEGLKNAAEIENPRSGERFF